MYVPRPRAYTAKDGTVTWKVRIRHNGRETSETFPNRSAADIFCADVKGHGVDYAIRLRDRADRERRGHTLDQVLDDYLEWLAPRVKSDRTVKDYRRRYELAIRPHLGSRPVVALAQADVRDWIDKLVAARHLSPKSIADRHALLHALVKHAMGHGWADVDACADTDLPKRRKGQPRGLRPAEWQALHSALRVIDRHAADLAEFLLGTGWRWGEATALSVWDVEDDGQRVWVTVTQVMRRGATGRARIVEDAKSDAGLRRVQLDRETATMLRRRMIEATSGGLVFTTGTGAAWHHSHFRSRAWEPAVKAANLARHPTPHWLRHTHVAWLAQGGMVSLPELQARLGHASIQTTIDVYGRMISDVRPEALEAFAAVRSGRPAIEAAARDAMD